MVPGQCLNTAVISSLCLLGEETARDTLIVVPVVGDTFAAFPVPGAVICTGAASLIVTVLRHIGLPFLFWISGLCIRSGRKILHKMLRLAPAGSQKNGGVPWQISAAPVTGTAPPGPGIFSLGSFCAIFLV